MEAGESDIVGARKRTESCGAGSDSDLSDGWNFVEHNDTNHLDVPSSDGESVEVIEPDNDSVEQVEEKVTDAEEAEVADDEVDEETQLVAQLAADVVPTDEANESLLGLTNNEPRPEEMFDTSFCWFLFFSVSAVLLSNVVFMAAESGFEWNTDLNILEKTPSFLRDLPVTPRVPSQERIVKTDSWSDKEETTVEVDKDVKCVWQLIDGVQQLVGGCQRTLENSIPKDQTNGQHQKLPLKINNIDIGKHFQHLGDASDSVNAQNNFAQTVLILEALHIGLNDLEDVVTDNSELKNTLKLQKEQLNNVLKEIESGVSRAMDKIASNVLFRVQKLERSFEKEWCELERSGRKEELKGLFYECPEFEEKDEKDFKRDFEHSDKSKDTRKYEEKNKNRHSSKGDYKYEVDKDSTGKYHSKSEGKGYESDENIKNWKNKNPSYKTDSGVINNNDYGDFKVNLKGKYPHKDKKEKYLHNPKEVLQKPEQNKFVDQNPQTLDENINYQWKGSSNSEGDFHDSFEHTEEIQFEGDDKFENNGEFSKKNSYKVERENYNSKSFENEDSSKILDYSNEKTFDNKDSYNSKKHENPNYKHEARIEKMNENKKSNYGDSFKDKSTLEKIGKYLKETCNKIGEKAKNYSVYEKLLKSIKDKAKVPIDVFNNMFQKYCKGSEKKYKENNSNQENLKGEFRGKSYDKKEFLKEPKVIEDPNLYFGNVLEFNVFETTTKQEGQPSGRNKIIEPKHKHRQWTFSYDEPPDNKTKDSNWFLKAGESRSKARWTHHRSDWLFDRASHRRHGSHYFASFPEKRKNWFFRRAYARQQCRETPYGKWCNFPQDDKVTFSSSKFR